MSQELFGFGALGTLQGIWLEQQEGFFSDNVLINVKARETSALHHFAPRLSYTYYRPL